VTELRTRWLADDVGIIDLNFQSHPALIASYVIKTSDGVALIETGPGSTIPALKQGLGELAVDINDIRHILVTHIHLDHAGASGSLLAELPDATLYVHERGARHMINPERLIASARQIYGALMDPLWGDFLPTPEDRTVSITDGDSIQVGDTTLDVHYTPGHASHHVAFHEPERNIVFAGDVAGVRVPPSPLVWPPTPPPDVDIEAWKSSTQRLRDLDPEKILVTHFDEYSDVWRHLDQLDARLDQWVEWVEDWRAREMSRDEMIAALESAVLEEIENEPDSASTVYATKYVTPFYMNVDGLMRYIDRRDR
jgi:glyoxylase-like metal-dependent hydrolase (beta-lactamase superfamily II)